MPTYEYACSSCGTHLEVVQKFTEDPLTECPACAGRLRKVFGSIGIVFKGSGFYKTDSRATSSAKGGSPDGDAKKPDGDGASKKGGGDAKEGSSTSAGAASDTKTPSSSGSSASSGSSGQSAKPAKTA